jgi:hypothetical protein
LRNPPAKSLSNYADLLGEVKSRIRQAQTRAILSANAEMIRLYWDIGHLVSRRQMTRGWGSSVIPRLARDIRNDLPEVKGFSERNIGRMIAFFREYGEHPAILPQPVAKPPSSHHLPPLCPGVKRRTRVGHPRRSDELDDDAKSGWNTGTHERETET